MNALVGYTGFVGSNIYEHGTFDKVYNSKNIEEAYGLNPDLLIYAGMRAEKYLANNAPEKDMELVKQAERNIELIGPKKLVLISTIDVLKDPQGKTENDPIETEGLQAYGYDRYMLECWVREHYSDALIIRLPGLFGKNIKKNFIYDYIHRIPFMLKDAKFAELSEKELLLKDDYEKLDNGFWRVKPLSEEQQTKLKQAFGRVGFSALNFTDSRSVYQFYPLDRLWDDIQTALKNDIKLLHLATEPVSAGEVYKYLTGEEFTNELSASPVKYDYRTIYGKFFGGNQAYILTKNQVLDKIKCFADKALIKEENQ